MSNVLKALLNIKHNRIDQIISDYKGLNRINNVGDALERYIQDAFADSFKVDDQQRHVYLSKTFSYLGNSNNPPDIILSNGDAIEVKKVSSKRSSIALNSSYPKNKLYSDDSRITQACRSCENWQSKDIIYIIGVAEQNTTIKNLFFIYGNCFAANKNVYERITNTISNEVTNIPGVDFTETNEIGKVKKIDPLGITDLRIRGMWHTESLYKTFSYIDNISPTSEQFINVILLESKFKSFPIDDIKALEDSDYFAINDIKIKDPDNPAKLIDAKHIIMETLS